MGKIFKDDLYDEFAWAVGFIPYGGANLGEIEALAAAVGDGGDTAFCEAWMAAGDRFLAQAADVIDRSSIGEYSTGSTTLAQGTASLRA